MDSDADNNSHDSCCSSPEEDEYLPSSKEKKKTKKMLQQKKEDAIAQHLQNRVRSSAATPKPKIPSTSAGNRKIISLTPTKKSRSTQADPPKIEEVLGMRSEGDDILIKTKWLTGGETEEPMGSYSTVNHEKIIEYAQANPLEYMNCFAGHLNQYKTKEAECVVVNSETAKFLRHLNLLKENYSSNSTKSKASLKTLIAKFVKSSSSEKDTQAYKESESSSEDSCESSDSSYSESSEDETEPEERKKSEESKSSSRKNKQTPIHGKKSEKNVKTAKKDQNDNSKKFKDDTPPAKRQKRMQKEKSQSSKLARQSSSSQQKETSQKIDEDNKDTSNKSVRKNVYIDTDGSDDDDYTNPNPPPSKKQKSSVSVDNHSLKTVSQAQKHHKSINASTADKQKARGRATTESNATGTRPAKNNGADPSIDQQKQSSNAFGAPNSKHFSGNPAKKEVAKPLQKPRHSTGSMTTDKPACSKEPQNSLKTNNLQQTPSVDLYTMIKERTRTSVTSQAGRTRQVPSNDANKRKNLPDDMEEPIEQVSGGQSGNAFSLKRALETVAEPLSNLLHVLNASLASNEDSSWQMPEYNIGKNTHLSTTTMGSRSLQNNLQSKKSVDSDKKNKETRRDQAVIHSQAESRTLITEPVKTGSRQGEKRRHVPDSLEVSFERTRRGQSRKDFGINRALETAAKPGSKLHVPTKKLKSSENNDSEKDHPETSLNSSANDEDYHRFESLDRSLEVEDVCAPHDSSLFSLYDYEENSLKKSPNSDTSSSSNEIICPNTPQSSNSQKSLKTIDNRSLEKDMESQERERSVGADVKRFDVNDVEMFEKFNDADATDGEMSRAGTSETNTEKGAEQNQLEECDASHHSTDEVIEILLQESQGTSGSSSEAMIMVEDDNGVPEIVQQDDSNAQLKVLLDCGDEELFLISDPVEWSEMTKELLVRRKAADKKLYHCKVVYHNEVGKALTSEQMDRIVKGKAKIRNLKRIALSARRKSINPRFQIRRLYGIMERNAELSADVEEMELDADCFRMKFNKEEEAGFFERTKKTLKHQLKFGSSEKIKKALDDYELEVFGTD